MKNIYVCGPTVYAEPHIGNMRPIITFDIYRRSLEALGEKVNFVHNITDIDDKIIAKAKELKTTEAEIAKRFELQYIELLKKANVIIPNSMPRVVEHMENIIAYIEKMVNSGNAYESNGNVFFSVESIKGYGSVSNRSLDTMRYEGGTGKKHPADFALWKKTEEGVKFDSPWGLGRPGWHTECAVFINKEFDGQSVDIHGGGIDLIFPHHENENAQYIASNGKSIAKEWRHVGHLNLNGEKMSKSLGNILSATEYMNKYSGDTLRYIFLTSSYSSPVDLSDDLNKHAFDQVEKFRKIYLKSLAISSNEKQGDVKEIASEISRWHFAQAMKLTNETIKEFNKAGNAENADKVIKTMELLGFEFTHRKLSDEEKSLIAKWNQLRKEKMFEEADVVRNELTKRNII